MHYRLPIGEDDFAQVRREYYFVDKSPFIREFMDRHGAVTLFTRPRRFGKTLMLSMLRYFFDIEQAEKNRQLFDGLAIAKDAEAMLGQGTRPVVFLTLRELKFTSWEKMESGLRNVFSELFRKYRFLLKDVELDSVDRENFEQIYMGKAALVSEMNALELLLHLLNRHYGRKPILLLDEYDTPIQQGWQYGFYDHVVEFMRVLLTKALKTNPSLDFAVLTGVLRISKESIFSDLNNLQVDSILSPRYPEAFGFTPDEVNRMAQDFGWQDKLPEIKDWYDGYRLRGREIYNPWSVLQYFANDCEPRPYWVNTSGNAILAELMRSIDDEHAATLESLLQGGSVQAFLREGVIYSDIGDDEDALYTMLVTTGYLTVAGEQRIGYETQYDLCLPNKEIQSLFADEILRRFRHYQKKSALVRLMQALLAGDAEKAQTGLSKFLESMVSAFDTGAKESFYHGFVLGMTAVLVPDYEVQSNREAGYGRFDVAVFPKDTAKTGLLLEFKTADHDAELADRAEAALKQIKERDYMAPFRARGIGQVHQYGVAFCGKQVLLKEMSEDK
ncbi:MAG: AAA family ATPase [Selenomonadaceae bacterium]|nr:AAA family ATPase [Selenomonadaceae bacterium]MDD7056252.1 AAA family ATPase [Selenomonadaceae bacterium]